MLIAAAALVPLGGFFAAVDSAILRVSPARVAELIREGRRGSAAMSLIVADKPRYTNLLLLLRVVCELLATVLVAVVLDDVIASTWLSILVATAGMTVVSYVLVGVGPRTVGRQHPYRVSFTAAPITRLLGRLLSPLSSLLILLGNAMIGGHGFREGPFATEVELRELVDLAEARGEVEHGEREMIHSVFDLGDTIVREVMVPRPDVVWIEGSKSIGQALALALRSGFSRIPVIGENIDDVIGIVYLKDLASRLQGGDQGGVKVVDLMRPATFVPESKPVDELLREMQVQRKHLVVVIDEYGGTAGLVTIEDILEEIVGEITDEYDNERAPVEWIDEDTARVTARLSLDDLAGLFGVDLSEDGADTVGGLLAERLGRVPIPGSEADANGLRLVAESVGGRRNRVDNVLVSRIVEPAEGEEEEDPDDDD
jgi:CBS domain containing-hemolysin-like protein